MFQQGQSPRESEKPYVGTRILMIAGVGLLISLGLCGAGALAGNSNDLFSTISVVGFGIFLLSLLGLILGVITLVVELIARR